MYLQLNSSLPHDLIYQACPWLTWEDTEATTGPTTGFGVAIKITQNTFLLLFKTITEVKLLILEKTQIPRNVYISEPQWSERPTSDISSH